MSRLALLAAAVTSLAAVTGAAAGELFTARLTGAEEVPTPVDTETRGHFLIRFNRNLTAAEYTLVVRDGTRATQAHIHCAAAGVNGPVIIFLAGLHDRGWDVDGKWVSNATVTDANITNTACGTTLAEVVQAMREGRTYANVHTLAHPAGEVRGQIRAHGHHGHHD
jgi:hypothetical protein